MKKLLLISLLIVIFSDVSFVLDISTNIDNSRYLTSSSKNKEDEESIFKRNLGRTNVRSEDKTENNTVLPSRFKLEDVEIIVTHYLGGSIVRFDDKIEIRGTGECKYKKKEVGKRKRSKRFKITNAEALDLVQELVRIRFHTFEDHYCARYYLKLREDGYLHEVWEIQSPYYEIIITLNIDKYSKSVRFSHIYWKPRVLDDFDNLVYQLVRSKTGSKIDVGPRWLNKEEPSN